MKVKVIVSRTYEDFVEDLVHKRTVKQICAIALSTRWAGNLHEIKAHAKKLRKIFRKSKKR